MKSFCAYVPTRILFGSGMVKQLHEQPLPGKKALVVISNGRSTKANGYLATVEAELHAAGVATVLFDRVEANPLKSTVGQGAAPAERSPAPCVHHDDGRHGLRGRCLRRHQQR